MKHVTILFLRKDDRILLAMKKRGFGIGKWNGVGGKLEPGETAEQAALRECHEEIEVHAKNIEKCGEIEFIIPDNPDFQPYAHVFITHEWDGEPKETDEMRPQWYDIDDIPYDNMWSDDRLWFPFMLDGKKFKATITVDETTNTLGEYKLEEVESL